MWLLNALTRKLEYFQGDQIPRYAILSHRWEDDEVTFDDVSDSPEDMKGYYKIDSCCRRVLEYEPALSYLWVDTCCIDKKSSAELSEAINSMYSWYSNAEVCFAYLADVEVGHDFEHSVWFSRGWTLQELLAPSTFVFYNRSWQFLGSKEDLVDEVSTVTGIPHQAITNFKPFSRWWSVAEKMSWASSRRTTRPEDQAYSLLGIFDINMSMLYGEGNKAFLRLQEEMMKVSHDASLFLWSTLPELDKPKGTFGILADSPTYFKTKKKISVWSLTDGYSVNNAGLTMRCYIQLYKPGVHIVCLRDWQAIQVIRDSEQAPTYDEVADFDEFPAIFVHCIGLNRYKRVVADGKLWTIVTLRDLFEPRRMGPFHQFGEAELKVITIIRRPIEHRWTRLNCITIDWQHFSSIGRTYLVSDALYTAADAEATNVWTRPQEYTLESSLLTMYLPPNVSHGIFSCFICQDRSGRLVSVYFGRDLHCQPFCLAIEESSPDVALEAPPKTPLQAQELFLELLAPKSNPGGHPQTVTTQDRETLAFRGTNMYECEEQGKCLRLMHSSISVVFQLQHDERRKSQNLEVSIFPSGSTLAGLDNL